VLSGVILCLKQIEDDRLRRSLVVARLSIDKCGIQLTG
jgi:hypothetical protein